MYIACVASVSVGLGSKERQRNGILVSCPHEKWCERQKEERGGGKEGTACKQTVFENLRLPTNVLADWLLLQVLMWLINKCVTCGQIDDIAQLVMASLFDKGDFERAGTCLE